MTYRIAEAADVVGVPATTLRYYEDIGLMPAPGRGPNGYRVYDETDVARLRFITATKNLGIPLADVKALAAAFDVEDCSSVAHQVVERVAARLSETQTRVGELVALAAQLQDVSARLAAAPTAGSCGDDCPCATVIIEPAPQRRAFVPLTPKPLLVAPDDSAAIACTLQPDAVPDRVADWQDLVARAIDRRPIDGGVSLMFAPDADLAGQIARLAAAEQQCCTFFGFTVHLTTGQVGLDVQAPADAADVVAAMFGAPV
ncbi:MerR family transcriptional regulator [Cellulomonas sp.]|uniref:MerR family transcriptional regulator n=1 Tax=Cellulomonas sp. TaxID=40001 RepID=UPI003BA96304